MKRVAILDPSVSKRPRTDWTQCFVCQISSNEQLRSPESNPIKSRDVSWYKGIEERLEAFAGINRLPNYISVERINDGTGIANTLQSNRAVYHSTCVNKFCNRQLSRELEKQSEKYNDDKALDSRCRTPRGKHSNVFTTCLFCDKGEGCDRLHNVETDIGGLIKEWALVLNDDKLLVKLTNTDLVATEAKYHKICHTKYYNRMRKANKDNFLAKTDPLRKLHRVSAQSIAFASVLAVIEDSRDNDEEIIMFKLSDLTAIYNARLISFGIEDSVNVTILKTRLLHNVPGLTSVKRGRNIFLFFDSDLRYIVEAAVDNVDDTAVLLSKVARIVRDEMFQNSAFTGSFGNSSQHSACPGTLLALVRLLVDGPPRRGSQGAETTSQAAKTITQLLVYNAVSRTRAINPDTGEAVDARQRKTQETPTAIYVALLIHAHTRQKKLIEKIHSLGLCISYDRLMVLSTDLANASIERFEEDGVVVPSTLSLNTFTVTAGDNVDKNSSSTTAKSDFHGTSISFMQQLGGEETATRRPNISLVGKPSLPLMKMPLEYTTFEAIGTIQSTISAPRKSFDLTGTLTSVPLALNKEQHWLDVTMAAVNKESDGVPDNVRWSTYYSLESSMGQGGKAVTSLLPLFHEKADTPEMVSKVLDLAVKGTSFVNPSQTAVVTFDQPLYALAKKLQWLHLTPNTEEKAVVVLGGLHTQLAYQRTLGNLLKGSGWSDCIAKSGITTPGRAEAALVAQHMARTQQLHQVTLAALYILQQQAYEDYLLVECPDLEEQLDFDGWASAMKGQFPQFEFWALVMELEEYLLLLEKSYRSADFKLYVEVLQLIAPWFFLFDHINYSRWLPVHIRDMLLLEVEHPSVFEEFMKGKFTISKLGKKFSNLPLDQAHEQLNCVIKGVGGAVGILDDPVALRRWCIGGPEVARCIDEFEASLPNSNTASDGHHSQTKSYQKTFLQNVSNLVTTILEMGNPFLERTTDLIVLSTNVVVEPGKPISCLKALGEQHYEQFVKERLAECSKPITAPLVKNCIAIFGGSKKKRPTSAKSQLNAARNDASLFGTLYVGCVARGGDMDNFFKHENSQYPPALTSDGKIRVGNKVELADVLISLTAAEVNVPHVTTKLIDGAALVQMLSSGNSKTFGEYAETVFVPMIEYQLRYVERLDLVFDVYTIASLKSSVRSQRGTGSRLKVVSNTQIPLKWKEFLNVDANKSDLFNLLSHAVVRTTPASKRVYCTTGNKCITNQIFEEQNLIQSCTHEEADTRLLLHACDAVLQGHSSILIRTVDTDVIVIATSCFDRIGASELFIAFGVGTNLKYIPIHEIVRSLGPSKSQALSFFHAFTGCDTVSSFIYHSKKQFFATWQNMPELTETFLQLTNQPSQVTEIQVHELERFVMKTYDAKQECDDLNEFRKEVFLRQKTKNMQRLPPTSASLFQQILRAALQSGHVWSRSLESTPTLPNFSDFGWIRGSDGQWLPNWLGALPPASKACRETVRQCFHSRDFSPRMGIFEGF